MVQRDIVVIGASAGGVEALSQLVRDFPADFPAAVFIVLHIAPHSKSVLPDILSRNGALKAHHAVDGEPIQKGAIYVAPPDHHLLIQEGVVRVIRGPRENGHRPAVDPLFRTAARYFSTRVIGVVLTGSLDDGTAGLEAVKSRGGVAVVQDPADAFHAGMPTSAIRNVNVDHILPLSLIGAALIELTQELVEENTTPVSEEMNMESEIARFSEPALQAHNRPGVPSGFTCPECHGALFELHEGELVRFRCRVGHAFSPDSLLAEQTNALESALWIALRALEESASLSRRVADRARAQSRNLPADTFEERAEEAERSAALIREVLLHNKNLLAGDDTEGVSVEEVHSADN